MTYFPQANFAKRAPRIKFKESVPVAIRFEGAQSIEGKLHDLSVTGGLLILSKPLEDGDFVEVQFPTRNGLVHGMAEILSTRTQSTSYCLQPFRFIALDDEDHNRLRAALKSAVDQITVGASCNSSASISAPQAARILEKVRQSDPLIRAKIFESTRFPRMCAHH